MARAGYAPVVGDRVACPGQALNSRLLMAAGEGIEPPFRERKRETDRETDRKSERQTERQTEKGGRGGVGREIERGYFGAPFRL